MRNRDFRRSAPFVLVLFPYAIGIAIAYNFPMQLWRLVSVQCFLIGSLWMYIKVLPTLVKYRLRYLHTGAVLVMIGVLGMITMSVRTVRVPDYLHNGGENNDIVVDLNTIRPGLKTNTAYGKVVYADTASLLSTGDKLLIQYKKEHSTIQIGSRVAVRSLPAPLPPKSNPYEFSYSSYLINKGVVGTLYLNNHNHYTIGVQKSNWQKFDSTIRRYIKRTINKYYDRNDASFLTALILGDKTTLNKSVSQRFAQTGIMHVLAVSGLHAGIVFMVFLRLFRPLLHKRFAIFLALIGVWLFAGMTGFTPSVSRACFMISLLYGGQIFYRKTSGLNSLAFAAFVLLTIQPRWIADIGFQLSCAALSGILVLQPYLKAKCSRWTIVPAKLVDLITVSLAAQLGTLPLSIFYFHQFPTYFLVPNVIVIPFIPIILVFALSTLLVGGVPFLCELIAWLNHCYLWFVHAVTTLISKWPAASLTDITLNHLQLAFAMGVLLMLYGMIEAGKWKPTYLAVLVSIFLVLKPVYNRVDTSAVEFTNQAFSNRLHLTSDRSTKVVQPANNDSSWATCQLGELRITNWCGTNMVQPLDTFYNVAWVTKLTNTSWTTLSTYDLVYIDRSLPFYKLAPYIRWCKANGFPANIVYGDYYRLLPNRIRMSRQTFHEKRSG